MSKRTKLTSASLLTIIVAGSVVSPVSAWHPRGVIIKSVRDLTTQSADFDANTPGTSLGAKSGDILEYTIQVSNSATS